MSRREYRDKMSWARTLILFGVTIVMACCLVAAYNRNSGQESVTEKRSALPSAERLMEVRAKSHGTEIAYANFNVDFNPQLHIPNYVAWELTREETEGREQRGKFMRDYNVDGCPNNSDYTGSGYDRGHMAPAADMKWNAEAMRQCFYMTNICPQAHNLNGGTWKKLEEKCRIWARADSAIIIVCGPVLTPEPDEFIGESVVAVPKAFFKVICSPFANPPRAIGFVMPNGRVEGGLSAAAVSVDSVEALTGYDFFAAMPDDIENTMEAECRFHFWSTIKPN